MSNVERKQNEDEERGGMGPEAPTKRERPKVSSLSFLGACVIRMMDVDF